MPFYLSHRCIKNLNGKFNFIALSFLLFTIPLLANAYESHPVIQLWHERSMAVLSELSESMFAGEGEGSELSDKILSEENRDFVIETRETALRYLKVRPNDPLLTEVLDFSSIILEKNDSLKLKNSKYKKSKAPIDNIFNKLSQISKYYGDVSSAVNCRNAKQNSEKIICSNPYYSLIEILSTRSQAYAIENATKEEIDHIKFRGEIPFNCGDEECLYEEFSKLLEASLGGESPLASE